MKTKQTHKAKRVPASEGGGYDYRGYRLQHPENEDGTESRDWSVHELDKDGEWIEFDRFSQLRYVKQLIDQWIRANA
ncbi:MAG TPA: hypothetical protein VM223_02460 [Planctomycetota bacterium]|nr:hypothetical protein [Planctomycetota bacterium]